MFTTTDESSSSTKLAFVEQASQLFPVWSVTKSSEQLVMAKKQSDRYEPVHKQIMFAASELRNYKSLTFCNVEYLFSPRLRFSSWI